MNAKKMIEKLETVDPNAEVVLVVYTEKHYESGYADRIDANVKYDSVTQRRLEDGEKIVEITTQTGVKQ